MEIIKQNGDFYTNIERAFDEIDRNWRRYNGIVVCGSHTPQNIEYKIQRIKEAREGKIPFLGICFGHQLAAIEYARNVLGIKDATSEEFGKGTFVVKKRKDGLKVGIHDNENYWNNYEVAIDWQKPEWFFTSQFHPEYKYKHPLIVNFLKLCKNNTIADGLLPWGRWKAHIKRFGGLRNIPKKT